MDSPSDQSHSIDEQSLMGSLSHTDSLNESEGQFQHHSKPRMQRGKQQRRTTYAVPQSPKKETNAKPYTRRSASPRRQSSPATAPDSNPSTETRKGPMGGKQVLPALPPGGVKLRKSVRNDTNPSEQPNGTASDDTTSSPPMTFNSTILSVAGVLAGIAAGAIGAWYYYTQYLPHRDSERQGGRLFNQ